MKYYFLVPYFLLITTGLLAQKNLELVSQLNFDNYTNGVTGYVAADGTEYALIDRDSGLTIVSLADPTNPKELFFVETDEGPFADVKVFGDYAYLVKSRGTHTLEIFDLSHLPDSVQHTTWDYRDEDQNITVNDCGVLFIDEQGYGFISNCGEEETVQNLYVVDLLTKPEQPAFVGKNTSFFAGATYVKDNIAYLSNWFFTGEIKILDVSDKSNMQELATFPTIGGRATRIWLAENKTTLFVVDGLSKFALYAYDVSDVQNPEAITRFLPAGTKFGDTRPSLVQELDNYLLVEYTNDFGILLLDASYPNNLIEVGSYKDEDAAERGNDISGIYTSLPSGLILLTDYSHRLSILKPTYQRACYLEGIITDAADGQPLEEVKISLHETLLSELTDSLGVFRSGLAESGQYVININKYGYYAKTDTIELMNGILTNLAIELEKKPLVSASGTVLNAADGRPLEGASVLLNFEDFNLEVSTDANGTFTYDAIVPENYRLFVGTWGFKTEYQSDFLVDESGMNTFSINLEPGYEDPFIFDLGWTSTYEGSYEATGFQRGVPSRDVPRIEIGEDDENDVGEYCFITANNEANYLAEGTAKLLSPIFDISALTQPKLSFSTNLYSVSLDGFPPLAGEDSLFIHLSNGEEIVTVAKIYSNYDFSNFRQSTGWQSTEIDIAEYITPTAAMQIIFEISNDNIRTSTKAAVDNFRVWDATSVAIFETPYEKVHFEAYPNPFQTHLNIDFAPQEWDNKPDVYLMDAIGRVIWKQKLNSHNTINPPNNLPSGIYFLQLRTTEKQSQLLKMVRN